METTPIPVIMARPLIADVALVVSRLEAVHCPKTTNKGIVGLLCEKLTGIPTSSAKLDCMDGEVKVFPLKQTKAGLVPKETIAVTMLNKNRLQAQDTFESSDCGTKMKRVLYIPYLREGEMVRFFPPTDLTLSPELTATLAKDYEAIRAGFLADGTLTSSTGTYLQTRTKGAGGDAPKTRAYYLRTQFITTFLPKTW
jgi:hypothetical protein